MELWTELKEIIAAAEKDVNAFYVKGNKKAGQRVRKSLQAIKALAQEVRFDIQAKKSGDTSESEAE